MKLLQFLFFAFILKQVFGPGIKYRQLNASMYTDERYCSYHNEMNESHFTRVFVIKASAPKLYVSWSRVLIQCQLTTVCLTIFGKQKICFWQSYLGCLTTQRLRVFFVWFNMQISPNNFVFNLQFHQQQNVKFL